MADQSQKEVQSVSHNDRHQNEGRETMKRERQHWEKTETLKTRAARFRPKILTNVATVIPAAI